MEQINSSQPLKQIEGELKKRGFKVGKSSVANYISELKSANIIENVKEDIVVDTIIDDIDFSIDNSDPPEFSL